MNSGNMLVDLGEIEIDQRYEHSRRMEEEGKAKCSYCEEWFEQDELIDDECPSCRSFQGMED